VSEYCANYCEENVWLLAGEPGLVEGERFVVLITSRTRSVPVWCQRAAEGPELPVFWDYHVILAIKGGCVYDFDSLLPFPSPLGSYLDLALAPGELMPQDQQPMFRVIAAEDYRRGLRSDRAHMRRKDGSYTSPPPPWPAPSGDAFTLEETLDLKRPTPGEVLDLAGLRAKLRAGAS